MATIVVRWHVMSGKSRFSVPRSFMGMVGWPALIMVCKKKGKYTPHEGKQEVARRQRQAAQRGVWM